MGGSDVERRSTSPRRTSSSSLLPASQVFEGGRVKASSQRHIKRPLLEVKVEENAEAGSVPSGVFGVVAIEDSAAEGAVALRVTGELGANVGSASRGAQMEIDLAGAAVEKELGKVHPDVLKNQGSHS